MAESIEAVHVEFTATTKQMQAELEAGARKAKEFGQRVQEGVSKSATAGGKIAKGVKPGEEAWGKLGQQVAGAPAAISAASAAMVAFGGKSAGAINAVGGGIASLLASGFTPLGLAIGAVTIAIGLFATRSNKALDDLNAKIKEQTAGLTKMGKEFDRLIVRREAARGGIIITEDEAERAQKINDLLRERAELLRMSSRNPLDALKLTDPRDADGLGFNEDAERKARRERIQQIGLELSLLRALEEAKKDVAKVEREVGRAYKEFEPSRPRLPGPEVTRVLTREELFDAMGFQQRATPLDLEDRPNRLGGPDTSITDAMDAEIERIQALDAERNRVAEELRRSQITFEGIFEEMGLLGKDGDSRPKIKKAEPSFMGGFRKQIEDDMLTIEEKGRVVAASLTDSFTDAFMSFADGTATASEAMSQFARSFIMDVGRMLVQQAALGFVSSVVGTSTLAGFATGGSFTVGGNGGVDSQVVAFKATPGERVSVSTPGKVASASGGVFVSVHNYSSAQATTRTTDSPEGPQIDILIEDVVERSLDGGRIGRAVQRLHGTRRQGRRG